MFGKKRNIEEKPKEEEQTEETKTIEAGEEATTEQPGTKEQLTDADKQLLALINLYKQKYDGTYNANDFLTANQAFIEAEKLNLSFALYAEITGLREDIKQLIKVVKAALNSLPN